MPFRNYGQFDIATVRLMRQAYDAALSHLSITSSDPRSGEIASEIAMLADEGERDPQILCTGALARIKPQRSQIITEARDASS